MSKRKINKINNVLIPKAKQATGHEREKLLRDAYDLFQDTACKGLTTRPAQKITVNFHYKTNTVNMDFEYLPKERKLKFLDREITKAFGCVDLD